LDCDTSGKETLQLLPVYAGGFHIDFGVQGGAMIGIHVHLN
jgi:hypothetical protein